MTYSEAGYARHEERLLNAHLAREEEAEAAYEWALDNGLDPETDDYMRAWESHLSDMAEDAAERQAEYREDARFDD